MVALMDPQLFRVLMPARYRDNPMAGYFALDAEQRGRVYEVHQGDSKTIKICEGISQKLNAAAVEKEERDIESLRMPKALTAENGTKAQLVGKFFEEVEVSCPEDCADHSGCKVCGDLGTITRG